MIFFVHIAGTRFWANTLFGLYFVSIIAVWAWLLADRVLSVYEKGWWTWTLRAGGLLGSMMLLALLAVCVNSAPYVERAHLLGETVRYYLVPSAVYLLLALCVVGLVAWGFLSKNYRQALLPPSRYLRSGLSFLILTVGFYIVISIFGVIRGQLVSPLLGIIVQYPIVLFGLVFPAFFFMSGVIVGVRMQIYSLPIKEQRALLYCVFFVGFEIIQVIRLW